MKITNLIFIIFLFSCSDNQKLNKNQNNDSIQLINNTNNYYQLLGDKLIYYDTMDIYGLKSPDTVFILKKSVDSLSLNDLNYNYSDKYKTGIINLSNYYTFEKHDTFAYFIKLNTNNNNLEEINIGEKTILIKIRKENFNTIDTVTTKNVNQFYSNYKVKYIDSIYATINPTKIYWNARTFSRLLKFDSHGKQINSLTIYNYQIKEVLRIKNNLLLGLNSEYHTNDYSNTSNTIRFVLLDDKFSILWIKEQKTKGDHSYILTGNIDNDKFIFNIEVMEDCGGCYDSWWKYKLEIYPNGNLSYSYMSLPYGDSSNILTLEKLYDFDLIDVSDDTNNITFCDKNSK